MYFLTHLIISLTSLIVIVFSCVLFTNAIEFLGNKLKLGNNATGSILAVLGTGLPETIIPIVAIFGIYFANVEANVAQNIASGAILGSPFMLSSLALFLLAIVLIFKKRNKLNVDYKTTLRNYKYFLSACFVAILFSFEFLNKFKLLAALALITIYGFFVYRTIVKSRTTCIECECEKLYFQHNKINLNFVLFLQLSISLIALIAASHFFVEEIKYFSNLLNISPAILALFITPFATELPECVNSIIWLKQNKDDLALANILGAIVFQSTILFSIGIFLTPWVFKNVLMINMFTTFISTIILTILITIKKKINLTILIFCGIVYFFYLAIILIK
ncbi:sodium:calcium antiporter [bacterium]|nr:sodium:calcium antiporter [bacterium]